MRSSDEKNGKRVPSATVEGRMGPNTRRNKPSRGIGTSNNAVPNNEPVRRTARTGQQQTQGRRIYVDLSKLKSNSLRKYMRLYDIRDVPLYSNKDDLCRVVTEHFVSMAVDEDEVLMNLMARLRTDRSQVK